jgi:hypothetical protein
MRGDERDDLGDELEVMVEVMRAGSVYGSGVILRVFGGYLTPQVLHVQIEGRGSE